jgi:hypothetical protein
MSLFLAILLILPFHAPPRWLFFYPVLVDNLWSVFMVASLLVMSTSKASTWKGILLLTIFSTLATFTREIGLLIPLIAIASLYPIRKIISIEALLNQKVFPTYLDTHHPKMDLLKACIPLAAGVTALWITRIVVSSTGSYEFALAAYRSIQKQHALYILQTMFVAFGPLPIFLFVERKAVGIQLRQNPSHVLFLAGILVLAAIGGKNTIRFLYWGAPVIFLLGGISLQNILSRLQQSTFAQRKVIFTLLAALLVLQIWNTHFWHGFYSDYSAWIQWGGLNFSRLDPLYIAACCAVSLLTVLLLNRWLPSVDGIPQSASRELQI